VICSLEWFSSWNFPTALHGILLGALENCFLPLGESTIFQLRSGVSVHLRDFVARLKTEEIKISCLVEGAATNNILVERLWRNSKYEEVYLRAYSDGWGS